MKRQAVVLVRSAVVGVVFAALVLSGCGSSGGGTAASAAHNAADVTFVTDMIPHHEQAVEMSKMAGGQASSAKIKDIATRIQGEQDPEIAQMKGYLRAWGQKVPASDGHGRMDMGGASGMGMLSNDQMGRLGSARGSDFDTLYAEGMIQHHQGAVEMAKTELAGGQNVEAKALATKIVAAQEQEIAELQALQTSGL